MPPKNELMMPKLAVRSLIQWVNCQTAEPAKPIAAPPRPPARYAMRAPSLPNASGPCPSARGIICVASTPRPVISVWCIKKVTLPGPDKNAPSRGWPSSIALGPVDSTCGGRASSSSGGGSGGGTASSVRVSSGGSGGGVSGASDGGSATAAGLAGTPASSLPG